MEVPTAAEDRSLLHPYSCDHTRVLYNGCHTGSRGCAHGPGSKRHEGHPTFQGQGLFRIGSTSLRHACAVVFPPLWAVVIRDPF